MAKISEHAKIKPFFLVALLGWMNKKVDYK
jgi:hypothetical protein